MTLRKFGVEHQKVQLDPADEQGLSKTALLNLADEDDEVYDAYIDHNDPCNGDD